MVGAHATRGSNPTRSSHRISQWSVSNSMISTQSLLTTFWIARTKSMRGPSLNRSTWSLSTTVLTSRIKRSVLFSENWERDNNPCGITFSRFRRPPRPDPIRYWEGNHQISNSPWPWGQASVLGGICSQLELYCLKGGILLLLGLWSQVVIFISKMMTNFVSQV